MKQAVAILIIILCIFSGCAAQQPGADIAATTLPVWEFTILLCEGTGLTVDRVVTESVSCLHDYSLNVSQVKAIEGAKVLVLSGAGLEDFLFDSLICPSVIDASQGIDLICAEESGHEHDHEGDHDHSHDQDPHIWLSPENAMVMAENICAGLIDRFPEHSQVFEANLAQLLGRLQQLQSYASDSLSTLSSREIITFHDGFAYFADSCGLTVLEAVEEESGSEASAQELKHLIGIIRDHHIPAVFTEVNGSVSAAEVIARETGITVFALDMAMGGDSYFDAMYHNIDTIKEALE